MDAVDNMAVLIVGAGPAGIATAACLAQRHAPYIIVEPYNRLKLHLAKEFCELPYMFLVVITGENSAASIPPVPSLTRFEGEAIHSSAYKSGRAYTGKRVLVVGAGNSGMEIAYDLATHGAHTSIVVRSPVHIMTKELIRYGMIMVQNLGLTVTTVDSLLVMAANFYFRDLSKHGIMKPKMGPLLLKSQTGRSAVIDVGTARLIKGGVIKINTNSVEFHGGRQNSFDGIVFATGYKSTVNTTVKACLKRMVSLKCYPNNWRGENVLYCAGFARRGLAGIAMDAKNIADDIVATMDKVSC
uniref:Flavin-containing monooxygenase n=1 Tax=Oryza punctata TaxID=4537 RepID=A0A0E0MGL2_ORYPU